MGRIVAIDYGAKRIGLAIGDAVTRIAMPWCVLDGKNDPAQDADLVLRKIQISGERVEFFVIGLPKNMDDTEGPQAKVVRDFGGEIAKKSSLPVKFQDERLSSFAAEKKFYSPLKERMGKKRLKKIKPKRPLDAVAAAVILESYFQDNP